MTTTRKGLDPTDATTWPSTIVYAVGLCSASMCTKDTDEDAVRRLNSEAPTGIASGWAITDEPFADGSPNPSPCPDDPARRHVLCHC